MNLEINLWLQDAILDAVRGHVADRVRAKFEEEHGASPALYIATQAEMDKAAGLISVGWSYYEQRGYPASRVSGEICFSPQNALRLFLGLEPDLSQASVDP